MLQGLVDPSKAGLRSTPRDDRDLMIAASSSWMYALDNVSGIQPWLSDALCRLATGAGYSTRELYTDGEEVVWQAKRPIVLNGIEDLANRSDLLDRCLGVSLPAIPDEGRLDERELWRRYEDARPRILGALLDGVAAALRNVDGVTLAYKPRMVDHARWAVAAEAALNIPKGGVLTAILHARDEANAVALECSPIAAAAEALAEANSFSTGFWEGTASELLAALNAEAEKVADKPLARKPAGWPLTAKGAATAIRRLAPNLRRIGVGVQFYKAGHAKVRRIRIGRIEGEGGGAEAPPTPSTPASTTALTERPGDMALGEPKTATASVTEKIKATPKASGTPPGTATLTEPKPPTGPKASTAAGFVPSESF